MLKKLIRPLFKNAEQKIIFLFLNQTYVVGSQKNRLNKTVLLCAQKHMLKLMGKKIFIILCSKILLI